MEQRMWLIIPRAIADRRWRWLPAMHLTIRNKPLFTVTIRWTSAKWFPWWLRQCFGHRMWHSWLHVVLLDDARDLVDVESSLAAWSGLTSPSMFDWICYPRIESNKDNPWSHTAFDNVNDVNNTRGQRTGGLSWKAGGTFAGCVEGTRNRNCDDKRFR